MRHHTAKRSLESVEPKVIALAVAQENPIGFWMPLLASVLAMACLLMH